jgi:hypothetical protein
LVLAANHTCVDTLAVSTVQRRDELLLDSLDLGQAPFDVRVARHDL